MLWVVVCLALLPACGGYQRSILVHSQSKNSYHTLQDGVQVQVRKMKKKEVRKLFGNRGRHLVGSSVVPLHVSVENRGSQPISVKPAFNAIKNSEYVYDKVKKNVAGITTGAAIGGMCIGGPVGAIALGAGFGMLNANKNEKIKEEIQDLVLIDREMLDVHESCDKIMFVNKADLAESLTLSVDNKVHTFTIA